MSSIRQCAPHGGVPSPNAHLIGWIMVRLFAANKERTAASASEVPFFALFEFVTSQLCGALRANNAKGGSCVVETPMRVSLCRRPRCGVETRNPCALGIYVL